MRVYAGLVAVVVIGTCLAELPLVFDFGRFAFSDAGWALTVNRLLDDGLVPTRDFAYFYGLLTLSIDRALFAVFGESPGTVGGLFLACAALIGLGVWRWARALDLGIWPRVLLLLLLPRFANPGNFPSPAHALEAVLLTHALAAQAGGRLGQALALTTLAVFVKPSLAYFLGLILLLQILLTPGLAGRWRRLLPASILGLAVLAYLTATFGFDALLNTQLPFEASKDYKDQNYGFFLGDGRVFWKPQPGHHWLYYAVSPAGVWLASSGVLGIGGLLAASRLRHDGDAARSAQTAAVLQAVFVCLLFGNRFSWFYYPYLPFVGVTLVIDRLPRWLPRSVGRSVSVAAGVAVGLLATTSLASHCWFLWRTWEATECNPRVAGLYATKRFIDGWDRVRSAAADRKVFVLTRASAAWALTPGVESPRVWFLSPPAATPGDWERVRAGIGGCKWLLVPEWFNNSLLDWPELADAVAPFEKAEIGPGFVLYRRRASPSQ